MEVYFLDEAGDFLRKGGCRREAGRLDPEEMDPVPPFFNHEFTDRFSVSIELGAVA